MVVKSKQLCEYPKLHFVGPEGRLELTAPALSLRDLGWRALLSVLCLLSGLCVSHTPSRIHCFHLFWADPYILSIWGCGWDASSI